MTSVSHTTLVERMARVLAGRALSAIADGDETSAGPEVGDTWQDYLPDALAILRTMREPDANMAAAGNVAVWEAMVRAALSVEEGVQTAF